VQRFPENMYLKLDYALKLLENGDIDEADNLLDIYSAYDPTAADVLLAKAKIQFWQGNYDSAMKIIDSKAFGQEKISEADKLKEDIRSARSVWLEYVTSYHSDDQPLKSISPEIKAGMYVSRFLKPYLSADIPVFLQDSVTTSAFSMSVGNQLDFFKPRIEIRLDAGITRFPDQTNTFTFNAQLSKTAFKHLLFYTQVARLPYLITKTSASTHVLPYHYFFSSGWNRSQSWTGKLALSILNFSEDNNSVYSFTGWIFAPPVRFSTLQFRIGYAYGYSTADENRYYPENSLDEIISGWSTSNGQIAGIYDPCYTPRKQYAHSALIQFSYTPVIPVQVGINTNLGFRGSAQVPYLFLDKTDQEELFVNKSYATSGFNPAEVSAFILYKLTSKIFLKADYSFLRNTFYTSHTAGINQNEFFQ
jgi:hypothetical protein